jgi:hypothetical protein
MERKKKNNNAPSLKIEGHSGCKLEILGYKDDFSVKKHSGNISYNKRLKEQMHKQQVFYKRPNKLSVFLTAEIIKEGYNDISELYWFSMRYVGGDNATEYFSKIDVHTLKKISDNYIEYFKEIISEAKVSKAPITPFKDKIAELKYKFERNNNLSKNFRESLISYLINCIPIEKLYIGNCHGDFSLTNQLYTKDNVFLLDFLDSFLDSPIIDIVKLRQDSNLGRIFQLDTKLEKYKSARADLSIAFLDNIIKEFIDSDEILSAWYPYLQVLNLARIIPYTESKKELAFLEQNILKIITI